MSATASLFRQTRALLRSSFLSLPRRAALALSMVLSAALAVSVLAGFLAMAAGFEKTLKGTGSPLTAVVLGGTQVQETGSSISAGAIRTLLASRDDFGISRAPSGVPLVSRELIMPASLTRPDGQEATLALRGMDVEGLPARADVRLTAGRMFSPSARELVAGESLARSMSGLAPGSKIRLSGMEWTVTGLFSAGGSAFESELWTSLEAVQAAFNRAGDVQSLRLLLTEPDGLAPLQEQLSSLPGPSLTALTEAQLYSGQSARTADLIRLFGWPVAGLMALGAAAGVLNTMFSAVSSRSGEIATLRALGFARLPAFLAVWIEAICLAGLGTALGVSGSWLAFNGWQASTSAAGNTRLAFELSVDSHVMLTCSLLGLALGLAGGALPALAAARLPLHKALRQIN